MEKFLLLKQRIKKNEGFSSTPYKYQLGFLTIGYGHLILSNEKYLIETKQHKAELEKLFIQDFNNAVKDYKKHLKKNTSDAECRRTLGPWMWQTRG